MTNMPDSFVPREYPEIVRDLLTTLTGGTVRETAVVPAGEVIELRLLANRPIRRVSHLQGVVDVERPVRNAAGDIVLDGNGDPETEIVPVPYRFTDRDFELFATGSAGDELDAIRFRPDGRTPPIGSTVTVNYYPTQTVPVPITDLNVGSVGRTMMESFGRELAVEELLMENVYRSAFVDTAEGANLDKVVALVGVTRRPPGVATARVRFSRAPGSTGRISIPTSTAVSDADGNRYLTTAPLLLEPGEPSREVLAAGESRATPAVEAGALDRLELLIAGISSVNNDAPAAPASAPETDDDLRRRARGALAVAARGTLDALKFGVQSIPGVKDVAVTEFPNGVPGEIRIDVAYERDGDAELEALVAERIQDLRPAGIRVLSTTAQKTSVTVSVSLTLAESGVPAAELGPLQADLEARAVALIQTLAPGATLRQAPMVLAALEDPRVVDAAFEFSIDGSPASTVSAPEGNVLEAVTPFSFAVETEAGDAQPGAVIEVDMFLPVHLLVGVTAADATAALEAAANSFIGALVAGDQITVDGLVAAARDDTRYQIVRADTTVTTESETLFLHLTDGVGSHPVAPNDEVRVRSVQIDVREGGV